MNGNLKNILSMVMLIMLAGCATVDTHWQEASSIGTVQAYESFLRRYPRGDYAVMARQRIESLQWQQAAAADTVQAYESFLKRYPRSDFVVKAGKKIESLQWQEATDRPKPYIAGLRRYLSLYPDGEHATDAKIQLELLEWEDAKKVNSLSSYEAFLEKYPTSNYSDQARNEIQTFAKVVIELPKKIAPWEHYKKVFTETNGVGIVFKEYNYILVSPDGHRYTRRSAELVESDWIKVPAKGIGIDHSYIPGDWARGSKVIDGWYGGQDANGHYIKVTFSYEVADN